jgi:UDP-glucose 4-epimerase
VEDAVQAIIALAQSPEAIGHVFNVGSTEEVSILELAKRVLATVDELAGAPQHPGPSVPRLRFVPYDEAYEAGFEDMQRRVPEISKIHQLVGWQPTRTLDDILQDVVEWAEEQRGMGSKGGEELR